MIYFGCYVLDDDVGGVPRPHPESGEQTVEREPRVTSNLKPTVSGRRHVNRNVRRLIHMNLEGRIATNADAAQLAAMNHHLIRDEGHRNSMSASELEDRMSNWLANEYEASIFMVDGSTAGYALYRHEEDWTYLRQFFILSDLRRRGLGRAAIQWLVQNPWQTARRIRLDVLVANTAGISFWRSVGFQDYCITMEMDT